MEPIRLQLPFQLSDKEVGLLIRLGCLIDDKGYRVVQAQITYEGSDKGTTVLRLVRE